MTRFWREGHWRNDASGGHFVSGHWVDRDSGFGGYAAYPPSIAPPIIQRLPANTIKLPVFPADSPTSVTEPNAICPICGARVFYYQNEHGSRVFFDSLGPPWPKHPCTDHGSDLQITPYKYRNSAVQNDWMGRDMQTNSLEKTCIVDLLSVNSDQYRRELLPVDSGWQE